MIICNAFNVSASIATRNEATIAMVMIKYERRYHTARLPPSPSVNSETFKNHLAAHKKRVVDKAPKVAPPKRPLVFVSKRGKGGGILQ